MAVDKFLIEASHIMMFARSVGDSNPIYHDENMQKVQNSEVLFLLQLLPNQAHNLILSIF